MSESWPEDCVQFYSPKWWVKDDAPDIVRGRLLLAFAPFPEVKPLRFVAESRGENPRDQTRFRGRVEAFDCRAPSRPPAGALPVTSMPCFEGEDYLIMRGKLRPVLVVGLGGIPIPAKVRGSGGRWQTSNRLLVAPYYGLDSGWNDGFVARARRAEWPQCVWDRLPDGLPEGSMLRLDHMFPLGSEEAGKTYRLLPFGLGDEAMPLLDEWLGWLLFDRLNPEGPLAWLRGQFLAEPAPDGPS